VTCDNNGADNVLCTVYYCRLSTVRCTALSHVTQGSLLLHYVEGKFDFEWYKTKGQLETPDL
jgi:hypothetical protein